MARPPAQRPAPLLLAWGSTLAACVAATWPLWTPLRDVPRIAPAAPLAAIPPGADFGLLAALGAGVAVAVLPGGRERRGLTIAAAALALLMLVDQLRWQPWALHALVVAAVLRDSDRPRAEGRLRGIVVAVYAFSALAKLDATFAQTLGHQLVTALAGLAGIDFASFPPGARTALALSLPLAELAVAGVLAAAWRWPRCRGWGRGGAVAMHALTVAALGPWGLGHGVGVLVWNAGFAWQTFTLFAPRPEDPKAPERSPRAPLTASLAAIAATCGPLLTVAGVGDQWPGWALYAPGGERATLYVVVGAEDRLPESLRAFVDDAGESVWRRVRLDDWVLSSTGAPIYPQNRIAAALAAAITDRSRLSSGLRIVAETPADRLGGHREALSLETPDALRRAAHLGGVPPAVTWTR